MPTYTPPSPDITHALRGTYYGLVHLGLATLAYASESQGSQVVAAVNAILADPVKFPPLPGLPDPANPTAPPVPLNGYWKLDWGGDVGDNANAIFIISFRQGLSPAQAGQEGAPYFFAVVNRGTDTSAWKGAVAVELFEDLDAFGQTPWATVLGELPNPCQRTVPAGLTGRIANGTAEGLRLVTKFPANWEGQPVTVAGAMAALLAEYPGTPLVVTGHSLGACLTQVVAAYLAWQLYDTQTTALPDVLPNPFAPPTPGDPQFAAMYDTLFPNGHFWFNTGDLVPCAWTNIAAIPSLWGSYTWPQPAGTTPQPTVSGPGCPLTLEAVEATWGKDVPPYARPTVNQHALMGSLPTQATIMDFLAACSPKTAWDSWGGQLLWQHFPPCYHAQISTAMPAPLVASFPCVDTNPPY